MVTVWSMLVSMAMVLQLSKGYARLKMPCMLLTFVLIAITFFGGQLRGIQWIMSLVDSSPHQCCKHVAI